MNGRMLITAVAFFGIWWCVSYFLSVVQFSPAMTDALVNITTYLEIYGNEDVEDFYLFASMLVAAIVSASICWICWLLIKRAGRGQ